MNHALHSVVLVYVHEAGQLEVGTVACVPRKGELVSLVVDGARRAHRVEQVEWRVNEETCSPTDHAWAPRFTTACVSLSRCP